MRRMLGWGGLLILLVVNLGACASMGQDAPRAPSLYKRLGGREGISLVVTDFTTTMVARSRSSSPTWPTRSAMRLAAPVPTWART